MNLLKLASMRKWNADTFYILFISSLHLGNTLKRMSMSNNGWLIPSIAIKRCFLFSITKSLYIWIISSFVVCLTIYDFVHSLSVLPSNICASSFSASPEKFWWVFKSFSNFQPIKWLHQGLTGNKMKTFLRNFFQFDSIRSTIVIKPALWHRS